MPDKLFVDTNVLVYLANTSSSFHTNVFKKFRKVSSSHHLFISGQVLREYAVIMTHPNIIEHPLTSDELIEDIRKWKQIFTVSYCPEAQHNFSPETDKAPMPRVFGKPGRETPLC